MDVAREIETLIRAKYPIIYIVSWEERRVEGALQEICRKLQRKLATWSITQGFKPPVSQLKTGLSPELDALAQIMEAAERTVFLLRDFHPYMKDPRAVRLLRDLAGRLRSNDQTVALLGPVLSLPPELEKDVNVIEYPLPNISEIGEELRKVSDAVRSNPSLDVNLSEQERENLIHTAQGLTQEEIESALARSLVERKRLDAEVILAEKRQIVRKSGLLEYYPASDSLDDVGGHEMLKAWLRRCAGGFTERAKEFGLPAPRGLLLLGVQGCGKSLVAKAIAAAWRLPMLRLDVGRIFGGLVGQSEANIRRAISVAESVAPCVLWADELEKGFAGTGSGVSDSGTTARVFATFLTWMQEKTKPVFLIATANDVSALPPELLRKGRFDEIFFIDLPEHDERAEIFRIHLSKRNRKPDGYDLEALAGKTKGFSGAEIEQVVVGALFRAFDAERELSQDDLMTEAGEQVPLSVMMAEEIDELRTWAKLRARPSSKPKKP